MTSSSSSTASASSGSDDSSSSSTIPSLPFTAEPDSNSSHPHIFVVLIDDQGFADMGYNNELDQIAKTTPFMDSLAADGVKLSSYYSQQLCTPARASLLTGKYPIHLGMQHDVIQPESPFGLPLGHQIMPAYLKEHFGYSTHMVGKWHLGHFKKEYLPWMRGFDNFFGYLSDQLWYYNHKSPHACKGNYCFYDMNHNGENAEDSIGVYSTFLFTDVVQQIMEESDPADPLFVYLSWQNVHAPLDPPPETYFSAEELTVLASIDDPYRRTFGSMTMILDNAMKKIVGQAKSLGYYDNSIMMVMSDNGGCPYSGGYNYPLRGAKQYLWEGGIRVNAFVHSPMLSTRARGTTYDKLFHVSDWLPTIVTGVLHAAPGLLGKLDGVDHWKHIVDPTEQTGTPRAELLHNIDLWSLYQYGNMTLLNTPVQAIRVGDWKLLTGQDDSEWYEPDSSPCSGGSGYCTPTYESTDDCSFSYSNNIYLFNISADPGETTNLATDYPAVVSELFSKIDDYMDEMEEPAFRVEDYHKAYQAFLANNDFIGPFLDGGHQ